LWCEGVVRWREHNFSQSRLRRNSGADRPTADWARDAAVRVPPQVPLETLRAHTRRPSKSPFTGDTLGLVHTQHPQAPSDHDAPRAPLPLWGSPEYVCVARGDAAALTEGLDDHLGPPRAVRGQQEPRHPPVHPRPPREADPARRHPGTPRRGMDTALISAC
jgi:hypothetical protein